MKKTVAIILVLCMAAGLCACGDDIPGAGDLKAEALLNIMPPGIGCTVAEVWSQVYVNDAVTPHSISWTRNGNDGSSEAMGAGDTFDRDSTYTATVVFNIDSSVKRENLSAETSVVGSLQGLTVEDGCVTAVISFTAEDIWDPLRLVFRDPVAGASVADYPSGDIKVYLGSWEMNIKSAGIFAVEGSDPDTFERGGRYQIGATFHPGRYAEEMRDMPVTPVTSSPLAGRVMAGHDSSDNWDIYVTVTIPDKTTINVDGPLPVPGYSTESLNFTVTADGEPCEVTNVDVELANQMSKEYYNGAFWPVDYNVNVTFIMQDDGEGFDPDMLWVNVPAGYSLTGLASDAENEWTVSMRVMPDQARIDVGLPLFLAGNAAENLKAGTTVDYSCSFFSAPCEVLSVDVDAMADENDHDGTPLAPNEPMSNGRWYAIHVTFRLPDDCVSMVDGAAYSVYGPGDITVLDNRACTVTFRVELKEVLYVCFQVPMAGQTPADLAPGWVRAGNTPCTMQNVYWSGPDGEMNDGDTFVEGETYFVYANYEVPDRWTQYMIENYPMTPDYYAFASDGFTVRETGFTGNTTGLTVISCVCAPYHAEVTLSGDEPCNGSSISDLNFYLNINGNESPYTSKWTLLESADGYKPADGIITPGTWRAEVSFELPEGCSITDELFHIDVMCYPGVFEELKGEGRNVTVSVVYDVPDHEHQFEVIESAEGNCLADGYELLRCSICGYEYREETGYGSHKLTDVTETPATCTSEGRRSGICTVCGQEVNETIPVTGHDFYVLSSVSGDCKTEGYATYACRVCGYQYTASTGYGSHSWNTPLIGSGSSACDVAHYQSYVCGVCGATKTELIPAKAHSWHWVYSGDRHWYQCSACSAVDDSRTGPHHMVLMNQTETYLGDYVCTECGYSYPAH